MKPFRGKSKPNIVDVAFGWYHEAYVDKEGRLYISPKVKLTSVRVEGIDEKDRPEMKEFTAIKGKPKIK